MRRDGGGVEGEETQEEEKKEGGGGAAGMVDEYRCPGDLLSFKLRKRRHQRARGQ